MSGFDLGFALVFLKYLRSLHDIRAIDEVNQIPIYIYIYIYTFQVTPSFILINSALCPISTRQTFRVRARVRARVWVRVTARVRVMFEGDIRVWVCEGV